MLSLSTATTPVVPTLTATDGIILVGVVAAGLLLAGGVVILGRHLLPADPGAPAASVVRSWIAISLVMALVVLCAAAFMIGDTSSRSTLFGGLISSVGAAVAFYFAAQAAAQAQAGIVNAVQAAQAIAPPTTFSADDPGPATVNRQYTYRLAADGQPAPVYGVTSGHLPDGLTLQPDGTLTGTPSAAGNYTFAVAATNTAGTITTGDLTLTAT